MAYRISHFSVTLSAFQGHSPTASLLECDFSQLCSTWQDFNRYNLI